MTKNVIKHEWGYELIFTDSQTYSGKILAFDKEGSKTNMFFQKEKDKTWFINSGKFLLRWIDSKTASLMQKELTEGETHHVPPLQCVQLEALIPQASITEVSNFTDADDEYHIIKGNNIG